ncbi:MAG TPA: FAD/NAD(P)-binding oxidoreductase [Dehalococcoidia bacterium]|nr:FAD/NAD(P)-binding oxidoreductase [Dehalococcoidia bacterium]
MSGKRVAILGGGMGGVVAANRLRRLLGREHQVLLIDRNVWHVFSPSLTWLMMGWRTSNRITRDLRSLSRKGIEFVCAEVTRIDLENRRLELADQSLEYDYLVVASGTEYGTGNVEGLGRAWTYYSLDGAEGLQEEISKLREGRIVILVSGLPYKGPASPYEAALLLDYFFWQKRLRDSFDIRVITPEAWPFPVAGREIGEQIVELLGQRNVRFSSRLQVQSVDQEKRLLRFVDGYETGFDLLIASPFQSAPRTVRESGLTGKGNWVPVDAETLATSFEKVYAIGDVAEIYTANQLLLPKLGTLAHGQAEVVARNIAAQINGSQGDWVFSGQGWTYLDIGYQKGIQIKGDFLAEPEPRVEMQRPSFYWHWARKGYEFLWLRRWF